MKLSKNLINQYLYFFIFSIYVVFNGGNSNLLIQINFIFISLFFLHCIKDKNYFAHLKFFYKKNEKSIFFYLLFLIYLLFQIIPFPIEYLKILSMVKYNFISKLSNNILFTPISFSPSDTFFQILNYISLLILVFILKMIFYKNTHKNRIYLFLSIIGFSSSLFAILMYLNNNPDFLFLQKSYYLNSSTGFFVNRTVFSIFLLFCLIASFEFFKNLDDIKIFKKQDNFLLKIYIRLFILFITIGIITTFSRIGNFLLLITVLSYLFNEIFLLKNNNKSFRNVILLIIFFDIIILGFYFGSSQLLDRFLFLNEELNINTLNSLNLSRFQVAKFGLTQIFEFKFFGYGAGSFETLFKVNFKNLNNFYANHSHSDIIEFIGEFGIIGISMLIISISKFFFNMKSYNFINLIMISYIIILLLFDFSLHIPIIQICLIMFLTLNAKSTQ
jgi:hypothetical protein